MKRLIDGEGYFKNDNRVSGGGLVEDGVLGCAHCHATLLRGRLTLRAKCWPCDGHLCPDCGLATYLHGHNNPEHWRTWPHHLWIQRAVDEAHRRMSNALV